ncbi:MAG: DUF488 domain-containing protein [candidate division WOR-3 bacterium]|jgi:uncharacterized protein (DUF488 family)|nr:DUF488 domain-containing protein [candidate division WOR-3 bacterium]MCR4424068.1 DUF488 domain-containing protein [candidate division WOR-3 bacterium]MDH7519513.1 DUF488 family protein [bacterium]
MKLYTLGTGHRPEYEFSRLLYKFGIQVLFDIRSHPGPIAEKLPHLSRAGMEKLCSDNKINYVFLGNELGGGCRALLAVPDRRAVKNWLQTEEVQRGLKIISSRVPTRVCCILCSCYTPEFCRRLILAEEVARQGAEVVHILEEDRFWQPQKPKPHRPR